MCGIVGHWGYAGRSLAAPEFRRFADSLSHRGPDGVGTEHFESERLWLGHRRLAIIDVSTRGRQPMSYADGRYWIVYNGEIYNYLELRETLRQLGHRFRSESDTEVILAAYAQWGSECQVRFNGMWAFAIWDARDRRLFLSRDRFGVKPLLYADVEGCFCFASELKSFLTLSWCTGSFDESLIAGAVRDVTGQESTPHTLLPGIKRLLPGHCMTVERGSIRIARWWDTLEHLPEVSASLHEQTKQFREVFLDACRLRLRSDVPIATSLSGGLDSSAVACTIAELSRRGTVDHVPRDWQRAFVACFPGTGLDEESYARQVVAYSGMRPHYYTVDIDVALEEIEKVIFDLEEIFVTPLVGPWAIYREMRRSNVSVSLDGHGSDELLGGYHFFVETAIEEMYGSAFRPGRFLDLKRVHAGLVGGTYMGGSGEALSHRGTTTELTTLGRQVLRRLGVLDPLRRVASAARAQWTGAPANEPLLPPLTESAQLLGHEPAEPRLAQASALQKMLYAWFHQGLLPTFLRCIDRASMAHGIEVRAPFLDWRLVTLGFGLPDESKIGGGYTKRILRLAMKGLMPDEIRLRTQKIHFSSPIGDWARGRLGTRLLDIGASQAFLEASAWNGKVARGAIEHAVAGKSSITDVWPVVNAYMLQQTFVNAAKEASHSFVAA